MFYKLRLFLYKLFHRREGVNDIVLFVCGNEELPRPLEQEEEERLLLAKDGGDENALQELISHNLRLVVFISKKFESTGIDFEDLISIGSIGLIKAVKTFKCDKNIRLATYASRCIENEILMQLRKFNKVKQDISLDKPIYNDKDGNEMLLADILPGQEDIIDENIERSADKKIIFDLVSRLNVREREIMILRYGLGGQNELTQREVAEKLGISQSYISRIEKRILADMKCKITSENLN